MAATPIRSTPPILSTTVIPTLATMGFGDVIYTPHRQKAATSNLNRQPGTHRDHPTTAPKEKTIRTPTRRHPQGRPRDIALAPLDPNRPSPA